eukprot:UN21433
MKDALEALDEDLIETKQDFTQVNIFLSKADVLGWDIENLQKHLQLIKSTSFEQKMPKQEHDLLSACLGYKI